MPGITRPRLVDPPVRTDPVDPVDPAGAHAGDYTHAAPGVLLRAAAAGDEVAWVILVRRYERLLRHVCRQHRLTGEQTDDVLQTTWTRLFTHVTQIREADRLPGWLVRTTARECVSVRRRAVREIPTDDCGHGQPDAAVVESDVHDRLDAVHRRRVLRQAVATLPPRDRALVELLLEPDLPTYAEISRRLGMPVGAIGPVRQRALRRLRDRLTDAGDAGTAQEVSA